MGRWDLADEVRKLIVGNIYHLPPVAPSELRDCYRASDVFVFPSFFEGFGLVLLEAMACGLPFIATEASGAGPDLAGPQIGEVIPTGNVDALVEALNKMSKRRHELPTMSLAVRNKACQCTWAKYRQAVSDAVGGLS